MRSDESGRDIGATHSTNNGIAALPALRMNRLGSYWVTLTPRVGNSLYLRIKAIASLPNDYR